MALTGVIFHLITNKENKATCEDVESMGENFRERDLDLFWDGQANIPVHDETTDKVIGFVIFVRTDDWT